MYQCYFYFSVKDVEAMSTITKNVLCERLLVFKLCSAFFSLTEKANNCLNTNTLKPAHMIFCNFPN